MAESCDLHQAQLDEQSLVRRLPDLPVELRQNGDGSEQELDIAGARLRPVSFEQRSGHFDQPQRFGALGHQQVAHVAVESRREGLPRKAFREHRVERDQHIDVVACEQHLRNAEIGVVIQHVERLGHVAVVERRAAERHGLVEHRQGVAHAAVGFLRDEVQRLFVGRDVLLPGDVFEVFDAVLDADAVEVVNLAPREDGRNDLVFLGRREDEDGVCGRLFERLEEGVEGCGREHVDLVDDEYRVTAHLRDDAHLLDQRADVLHRVVRCGVQLVDVQRAALVERAARFALVAGFCAVGAQAVDGLCKDAGAGGLSHAAGTAEEVGMGQLGALDGVFERRGNMFLPDDRGEGRGAVFACADDKITHSSAKIRNMSEDLKIRD